MKISRRIFFKLSVVSTTTLLISGCDYSTNNNTSVITADSQSNPENNQTNTEIKPVLITIDRTNITIDNTIISIDQGMTS